MRGWYILEECIHQDGHITVSTSDCCDNNQHAGKALRFLCDHNMTCKYDINGIKQYITFDQYQFQLDSDATASYVRETVTTLTILDSNDSQLLRLACVDVRFDIDVL